MRKKLTALFLVMVMSIVSFGCGKDSSPGTNESKTKDFTSDVLVIGGGGTGLVAALSAAEKGANVILLEKQGTYGGATSMSSGKIPAVGTKEQTAAGYKDSVEALIRDIYRSGAYSQNKELLKTAAENATPIKEWIENQGVKWTLETSSIYYGQSTYRIHVAEGAGAGIVDVLVNRMKENKNILSFTNMPVTELISENGAVTGAKVVKGDQTYVFKANSVVLATSGFGANRKMIEEYTPAIKNAVPNVAKGATGEGILWGMKLGAATAAMNAYQAYAPITYDTHNSLGSAFLDNGGILVNKEGTRFISEYLGYSPLGTAIANQTDATAWMIWDSNIQNKNFPTLKSITKTELYTANTPEELAKLIGVDAAALANEFSLYQAGISKGEDYLNRTKLPAEFKAPYYATKVTVDYRHTQGGLVINPTTAAVVKADGTVIPHLFAGGGVTEGFSSNGDSNYMAGNGLLQAFVFGRNAGQSAAKDVTAPVNAEAFKAQEKDLQNASDAGAVKVKVSDTTYKDGSYTGIGKGKNGDINVTVTVKGGKISEVKLNSQQETKGISDPAIEKLPKAIVGANGTAVEVISGATLTSQGIIDAVNKALESAK